MALSTRLPDPAYQRHFTGKTTHVNSGNAALLYGDYGPGFASVKVTSDQKVMMSRTNSQRLLAKAVAGQKWKIDIDYHPMTQLEFRPVDAFLQMKQGALTPFEVALPQYTTPSNTAWVGNLTSSPAGTNGGNGYIFTAQTPTTPYHHAAGSTNLLIGSTGWAANEGNTPTNIPLPGEMFTITDPNDSNHAKAYMITTVETHNVHISNPGAANKIRLGISPPLSKAVSTAAAINFINPLFKVVMPTATRGYSLNTDNLYKFSLKLEEYL